MKKQFFWGYKECVKMNRKGVKLFKIPQWLINVGAVISILITFALLCILFSVR